MGLKLSIRGVVQGVGFRPFVFNLAERLGLTGWVQNTSAGVEIQLDGSPAALEQFTTALQHETPALARIDQITAEDCPTNDFTHFTIRESLAQPGAFLPIAPDVAICADCRRELFTPTDRRYRYPFINCTNCGPRFSIITDIPYDRPNTSMAGFALCPDCQAEYDNPRDRRFHAQPVACPVCGPRIWFEAAGATHATSESVVGENALQTARAWLADGKILAIKGLGGFHLACDAANPAAVEELRRRKQRSDKAFALMSFDLETIRCYAHVSPPEAALLSTRQAPIVLLERRADARQFLPSAIAPGQHTLGFLLPYTPLHLLLLEPAHDFPAVLVMTSANISEEPIAYRDEDARARLSGLADGFLLHDRPIHTRVDDSVARVAHLPTQPPRAQTVLLRRARGYAPDSLSLPHDVPPTLATGAELKNTFCLARDEYAFLSHHIGDLENYETLVSFEEGIRAYERLFRVQPERIACDLHPNYLATRYAQTRAAQEGLPLTAVQHHHAHLAACLADNQWDSPAPVIGLCFDGTGYGPDGAIWGGEALIGGYAQYTRRFHLAYVPLPGGDSAVRKPARMALAHLWSANLDWEADLPPMQALCEQERTLLHSQLTHSINAPLTSSMGRLFDAASALIGVRQTATYEGQAAIELEALADPHETGSYPFPLTTDVCDPAPLWAALLADWRAGTCIPTLAARFHNSVIRLALEICQTVRTEIGADTVAISGGVWQNMYLFERTIPLLEQDGFRVLLHQHLPPNDGCIALGQVMVANALST